MDRVEFETRVDELAAAVKAYEPPVGGPTAAVNFGFLAFLVPIILQMVLGGIKDENLKALIQKLADLLLGFLPKQ